MITNAQPHLQHSFIIRLWFQPSAETTILRVSVTDVQAGQRVGFESLIEAFAFIASKMNPRIQP